MAQTVKEVEEALRDARRKQQIEPRWMRFHCGEPRQMAFYCGGLSSKQLVDRVRRAVESFGASDENLIGVLNWYGKRGWLYEDVLSAADAPDDEINFAENHINALRRALPPLMDMKYIRFVAMVARKLGIPTHRMQTVAEGIASSQDQLDIAEIELQRFVKLMTTHREDWKAAFDRLNFHWRGIGFLTPPDEFKLAIAKFDFLVELELHTVANADTLISGLIRNPENNLKRLRLIENKPTAEGFGRLGQDLASQECKVESLHLIHTNISKEGWEKAFQHGICNKLVELEMEFTGLLDDSAEVFFNVLTSPNCSLQTLSISEKGRCIVEWICKAIELGIKLSRLHWKEAVFKASDSDTKRLSEALSNPHCELEELKIDPTDQGLGWLGQALQNPNGKLKRLVMRRSAERMLLIEKSDTDACDSSSFWSALRSPDCKLRHLVLQDRSLEDVSEITMAIAESKLESLDLRGCKIKNGKSFSKALTECKHLKALTIDDLPWPCILESGIEDLTISSSNVKRLKDLCQFLGNPKCKLRKFRCSSHSDADRRQVLAAVEKNYQSCLQELDLHSGSQEDQHRCSQLLERNKIFQNSAFKEFCRPSSAKLFLCGNSDVGKTTIRTNLCGKDPSSLQRHASTIGIELQPLPFESTEQKLVIYDLAGQQHFHAFHHYFLRGSEKYLFLIVCKIVDGNAEDFDQSLIYWLRCIASHQSASPKRRPKVLIALNSFIAKPDVEYDRMQRVSRIITEKGYRNVLNLGDDVTEYCFTVVATDMTSLACIKTKLGEGLESLLWPQPDIPREFLNARTKLIQHASQEQRLKLIPVKSVGEALLPGHSSQGGEAVKSFIKFILQFLHDCGDAIYFGLGHEEDDIVSRFVILDVQWFMRDVVQLFMDSSGGLESRMSTDVFSKKLQDDCTDGPDIVNYTLGVLHEMGMILPCDDKWDGSWYHPPSEFIVPALLKEKHKSDLSSSQIIENYHWWGRRFECKEKELKLLPASIFAIILVKLHNLCKQGFNLGDGWVELRDNLVNVIVTVGGDTDRWEDRQWIDVLIFVPQVVEERPRPDLEEEAEKWMVNVRDGIYNSCPSLELEESVMRHGYVLKRISGDNAKPKTWDAVVCGMEVVRDEATARGFDYSHTWNDADETYPWDVTSVSDGNTLKKLLMPSERKILVKEEVGDSFHDRELELKGNLSNPVGIQKSLEVLERDQRTILDDLLKVMMKLNVDSPKYPYVTDRDNILTGYSKELVGESVKVHYMCEWSAENGPHEMKDSTGVDFHFSPHWLLESAPVFTPARILLSMAAKIGGHFAGVGPVVNAVIDEPKESIMDFLDSDGRIIKKPEMTDLKQIFELVRNKVGKEEDQGTIMATYFSLYPKRTIRGRIAWVCKEHLK